MNAEMPGAWWRRFLQMDRRRFLANLNVFVPLLVYGYFVLESGFSAVAMPAKLPTDAGAYESFGPAVPAVALPAWTGVLALIWITIGLSPQGVARGREQRHRLGHFLLAAINLVLFSTALLPLLLANLTGVEAIGHLMWLGLPVLIIAPFLWPFGLVMVWTSRGPASAHPVPEPSAASPTSSAPTPQPIHWPLPITTMKSSPDAATPWRVGHTGCDCMYYEEPIDGRWERLEISGEMLMGEAHHVIYFASAKDWDRYPEWARSRRTEIIRRIKSAFREPDYEYQGE